MDGPPPGFYDDVVDDEILWYAGNLPALPDRLWELRQAWTPPGLVRLCAWTWTLIARLCRCRTGRF